MKKRDVILEVQSIVGCGWQIAKSIVQLAEAPPDTFRMIGPSGSFARLAGLRRPMSQSEAHRIVTQARTRIELVDASD